MRIIFHVDVNNAFLSWSAVDLLRKGYPVDIRTIPSIIGGDETKRRGIVLAKSPIAKKYGIVTAETIYSARKKCPQLQVFPANYAWYRECSLKLMNYLSQYTPSLEQFSIDECFLDFTGTSYLYKDYFEVALKIKEEIKEKFGFTVNIGIASNKLCAKMASDFEKPDKIHTLFPNEVATKMWTLPVGDLFMVGKRTKEKLLSLGIKTIGDLANAPISLLKRHFKNQAISLKEAALGKDDSKVVSIKDATKCISVSETLQYDYKDPAKLKKILFYQAEEVGRSLRKKKMYAKSIAVTYKNAFFKSYSHQMTLVNPTNLTSDIYQYALVLFEQSWREDAIRNIGIRLSDLTTVVQEQVSFFEEKKEEKNNKVQEVIDQITNKYGKNMLIPASYKEDEIEREEKLKER